MMSCRRRCAALATIFLMAVVSALRAGSDPAPAPPRAGGGAGEAADVMPAAGRADHPGTPGPPTPTTSTGSAAPTGSTGSSAATGASGPSDARVSPAAACFAEIMRLIDEGDEAAITAFVHDRFTPGMQARAGDAGILPFLLDNVKRFHGFMVGPTLSATSDQVTILVRPRSQPDRWLRYVIKVESAPPHRVEGLFLMPAAPGDLPAPTRDLEAGAAVSAFDKEIDRAIAAGFSGVVLLARGGKVVVRRAAGEADRDHHVPVTDGTVFGLASMNKMFTAVAIGHLVEQGKIAWKDPVGKHLHGWLPEGLADSITIEQLLTHTSGLGDYLDRISSDPKIRDARTLEAYRDLVRASKVTGTPEDGLRYSNTGYLVLGALIEEVTGRSYFEFVRSEIYARAGMERTDSWCRDEIVADRAIGYIPPDEAAGLGLGPGWRSNLLLQGARGTSAGGGYSTAGDLLLFARALVEARLVRRDTLEELLRPRTRFFLPGTDYGYGFVVRTTPQGRVSFGHEGGFPGVNGELRVYGDGQWTLVVLSNVSNGAGAVVSAWDALAARLLPETIPPAPAPG